MRKLQTLQASIGNAALPALVCLALSVLPSAPASADDWMFRRSYFSHAAPPEVEVLWPRPESRSAYRPAVVGYGPGVAVRGGTRINRIFLRSGLSTDWTVIRQDWVDVRP